MNQVDRPQVEPWVGLRDYRLPPRCFGFVPPRRGFVEADFRLVDFLMFFAAPRVPAADDFRGLVFLRDGGLVDFRVD